MMSVSFVLLLLSVLLLPGLAIVLSCGIRQHRYLVTIAVSYGLFAIISVASRLFGLSFDGFSWLVLSYLALTVCLCVCLFAVSILRSPKRLNITLNHFNPEQIKIIVGAFGIVSTLAIYYCVVGPYTEIPADIYYHIEKFSVVQEIFSAGSLGKPIVLFEALTQGAEVWYHLLAFVALATSASTDGVVYWTSFVSMALFLLAVYAFSLRLFKGHQCVVLIAVIATFLMSIHYGVTVFSYIRYYSFAPAMLAFIFYFYAVSLLLDILEKGEFQGVLSRLLCVVLLIMVAMLVHKQEAMYIIIQLSVMLNVFVFRKCICNWLSDKKACKDQSGNSQWSSFDKATAMLVALLTVVFSTAYLYLHFNKNHFGDLGNRLLEFGPAIGVLPQLSILNPSYQFMQVVTLWGLLVYLLFFLNWKRYQHNVYLMAGMLLPLFTVFNPFFTDFFLRMVDSTVLWRFCFLLPIHYVAADLLVFYGQNLLQWGRINNKQKLFSSISMTLLLVLLLPLMNTWKGVHFSRYPTLKSVSDKQSYQHLQDVITFLNSIPSNKTILTDPVTGYVLTGFTKHYSSRDKFAIYPHSGFKKFTFEDYASDPLAKYTGSLLVVNMRTIHQGDSFVGALSRHWPTDLFKRITPFYTDSLLQHLEENEYRFKQLYQHQGIAVYQL